MSARRERPEPVEQLRLRLTTAKAVGFPFAKAWPLAWQRIVWAADRDRRRIEKRAIAATREAWRRAYEDAEPERHDGAAVVVLDFN